MVGRRYFCTSGDGTTLEVRGGLLGLSITVEWQGVPRCIHLSVRQVRDLAEQLQAHAPPADSRPEWEDIP